MILAATPSAVSPPRSAGRSRPMSYDLYAFHFGRARIRARRTNASRRRRRLSRARSTCARSSRRDVEAHQDGVLVRDVFLALVEEPPLEPRGALHDQVAQVHADVVDDGEPLAVRRAGVLGVRLELAPEPVV